MAGLCERTGLTPGQYVYDLPFPQYFCFPLSVPFHHVPLTRSSVIDDRLRHQLTATLSNTSSGYIL